MENEQLISVADAAKFVPSKPSPNAVWRWMRRGVRARNGETVMLEHRRYGFKLFTSREALDRFAARLAAADAQHFDRTPAPHAATVPSRSGKAREREVLAAKKRLRASGI